MRVFWCCTMLVLASSFGCTVNVETSTTPDSSTDAGTPDAGTSDAGMPAEDVTSQEGSATQDEDSIPRDEGSATHDEGSAARDGGSATRDEGSGTAASQPPAKPERVKADVGEGKKGRSLDKYDTGVQAAIAGPAKAYFGFREKAIFQIQIPQAMQLYKGTHGSAPKTHDEFMSQIIEANKIKLPELQSGRKYVYDPEKEELMITK